MLFLMPMLYSFHTRYKGQVGISAWGVKYFIPVLFISLGLCSFSSIRFILGVLFLYSLYEIGYIQNDCETIKKENNPTIRLGFDDLTFYEHHKVFIYIVRLLETVVLCCLLYDLGISVVALLCGLMTLPVFLLYNKVRSGFSLAIHLILMLFRYSVPVFISIGYFSLKVLLFILVIYPLTLFVERSVKGKFGYRNTFFAKYLMHEYEDRYIFRVKYYVALIVLTVFFICFSVFPYTFVIPVGILLLTSILNVKNEKLHYER